MLAVIKSVADGVLLFLSKINQIAGFFGYDFQSNKSGFVAFPP